MFLQCLRVNVYKWLFPDDWTAVSNSNILAYELLTLSTQCLKYWNLITQQWLQECVYKRTGCSLAITYAVNAVWHGLDAGYYVFAAVLLLSTVVERSFRLNYAGFTAQSLGDRGLLPAPVVRLLSHPVACLLASAWHWLLSWYTTVIAISYVQVYFYSLSLANCIIIWNNTHTWMHVYIVGAVLILVAVPMFPKYVIKTRKIE